MTKTGPSKPVNDGFAEGRLDNARAFLEAAEVAATLADPGDNANPIVSHIVNSVIAYTDALTARYGGRVNQQDHDAAVKALRNALGNTLPRAQENRLGRILKQKDEAQYGARRPLRGHSSGRPRSWPVGTRSAGCLHPLPRSSWERVRAWASG